MGCHIHASAIRQLRVYSLGGYNKKFIRDSEKLNYKLKHPGFHSSISPEPLASLLVSDVSDALAHYQATLDTFVQVLLTFH